MTDAPITLPYHWTPRPYQRRVWNYLLNGGKRAVVCWPRRHGKDDLGLHFMCLAAHKRIGNYWYMLPEYAQARKSIWDAINPHTGKKRMEEAFPLFLRKAVGGTNNQEMKIDLDIGSTVQLVGSDNFLALIGSPPVGMIFSEWKVANPSAWGYLRPILLENGGWAYFNSTPQGKNHFYKLCKLAEKSPEWFYEKLTNDDTHLFTEEEMQRELMEMQEEHGDQFGMALWLQEYYTSFDAAVPGAIWGEQVTRMERQGRILDFEIPRGALVDTGWDLGRTDDTAIWFRIMHSDRLDVIDHFAAPFMDIENAAEPEKSLVHVLLRVQEKHGIRYGTHFLPHDARPRTLAAGGKSILQQFTDALTRYPQLGRFVIAKRLDKQEGIQAGRKTFQVARFHKTNCADGLESLRHYHREWDDENKMFLDTPKHDWASHDADAWITQSLTWKFSKDRQIEPTLEQTFEAHRTRQMTMGELRKQHLLHRERERAERMA